MNQNLSPEYSPIGPNLNIASRHTKHWLLDDDVIQLLRNSVIT